jgi:hypothetical protein
MSITLRGNRVLAPRQIVMLQHGHDVVDALGIVAVITCYATTPSPWNALATWGTSSRLISAEGLRRPHDRGLFQRLLDRGITLQRSEVIADRGDIGSGTVSDLAQNSACRASADATRRAWRVVFMTRGNAGVSRQTSWILLRGGAAQWPSLRPALMRRRHSAR